MEIDHPEDDSPKDKCQHPGCGCKVEPGQSHCSEYCRSAAEYAGFAEGAKQAGGCNCGHPECVVQ